MGTHYNNINANGNNNLDRRLRPGNSGQNLNITSDERDAVIAFLKTLTGSDMYTNEEMEGSILIIFLQENINL